MKAETIMSGGTTSSSGLAWDALKTAIHEAFSSEKVNIDEVKQLMSTYVSRRSDWAEYENFDKHRLVRIDRRS